MAKAAAAVAEKEPKASKVSRGVKADAKEPAIRAKKYDDTLKIKILNKENPHREGTGRADAFNAMLGCKTMKDYYDSGHKIKYVKDWSDSKHIEVG